MSACLKKKKSPCCLAAHTDFDSLENQKLLSLNHDQVSIASSKRVLIYPRELLEAIRLSRLAASTGETRHMQASVLQLEGIAFRVGLLSGRRSC
jgi:hypothetical protein